MSFTNGSSIGIVLNLFKTIPATLILIFLNVAVFTISVIEADSLTGINWMLTLLELGALFNPLTLGGEWYRIFTQMFLHAGALHLLVNMYGLFSVGSEVERLGGSGKVTILYFICGIAGALTSLYWRLFTIGVGASGAIFGLFGYALVADLFFSRRNGKSMVPIVINFAVFLVINLLIAEKVNADNAAHFGGLAAGLAIGGLSIIVGRRSPFREIRIEYFAIPLLIVVYFILPAFQVKYYQFFQQVVAAEDSTRVRLDQNLTDEEYLIAFRKNIQQWDSALQTLDSQRYLPDELASDTFKLRRYLRLRKQEDIFRKTMIERESYIYLDSVAHVQQFIPRYTQLDYSLRFTPPDKQKKEEDTLKQEMVKVLYDDNWVEVESEPARYYRLGFRDSTGRWEGFVQDYYHDGLVQMKGRYKSNKRDGVFLYYSDHNTYTSAGRYVDDRPVGKWETFHDNGQLASETYYNDGYFLKNLWDSLGNQLVIDGNGKEVQRYSNGVIATEGEYKNGNKEGYWYGLHPDGQMYFEETYSRGRLMNGRSRNINGETFVYDASSLFPLPEAGSEKFRKYLLSETDKIASDLKGQVRLSFRVTRDRVLTDLSVEKSLSPELDTIAMQIVRNGPGWMPARIHGHEATDGFAFVVVEFN